MKSKTPSMTESDKMMKALCERGIVSASMDDRQCKMKVVQLGLTIPEGRNDCLLFGKEGQDAMYIFVYFRDPARDISDQGFIGLRFDFAKYRSNALASECNLREACLCFTRAVAEMTGIELSDSTCDVGPIFRN
jgi:hypothetical protein